MAVLLRIVAAVLPALALCPCVLAGADQAMVRGRAVFVADGDTFRLEDGRWVRLWGIDAPELAHGHGADQFWAREARAALAQLVQGRDVVVVLASPDKDRHGRLLGLVRTAGAKTGPLVNETLVARGCAFYFPFPDHPDALRRTLLPLQVRAMDQGLGFWPALLAAPGAGAAWVGNSESLRAFPADSAQARSLAAQHRVPLDGLEAVFRAGYAPARPVTPWPAADEAATTP